MEHLKQYVSAVIAAAVACVFLIVGALALTVLKPSQESASSVVASHALVMTRDGVLPLLAKDVRIDARSLSGSEVALGVGTPGDVIGWIGDDSYTEVVGITADRAVLKVEEHEGISEPDSSQSGKDAPAGIQQKPSSSDASQSAADSSQSASVSQFPARTLERELESSDMWLDKSSGTGSASLVVSDIPLGRSLIAASAAGEKDLELTLTWSMKRVNTLAIVSFLGAGIFVLIAGVGVVSRRHLLQRRRERAEALSARAEADETQTQMIDTTTLVERIAAKRREAAASTDEETAAPPPDIEAEQAGDTTASTEASDMPDASELPEEMQVATNEADETRSDDRSEEAVQDVRDGHAAHTRGRHALTPGVIDEDPPEKVPTDTGIIDLSAIRPGAALPSRRALREAREKGEKTIIIDGREFDTGLIPLVGKTAPASSSGEAEAGSEAKSSWKSLMSGWLKKDES